MLCSRRADERFHAPGLRLQRNPARSRQTVVPTPLVVLIAGSLALLDQGSVHQSLQGPIERARPQTDLAAGLTQHFLQDAVAVTLGACQGEQHVEDSGSQGAHQSVTDISVTDIYVKELVEG